MKTRIDGLTLLNMREYITSRDTFMAYMMGMMAGVGVTAVTLKKEGHIKNRGRSKVPSLCEEIITDLQEVAECVSEVKKVAKKKSRR